MDCRVVLETIALWRARYHTDRLLLRLRDAFSRAAADPSAFLDEAVRAIAAQIAARGAAFYIRDTVRGSPTGARWMCVTTAGEPPPEVLASEPAAPGRGRAHILTVADRHLIMHVGEVPDVGHIGVLIVTPARGLSKRAMAREGLKVCEDLLSVGATQLWLIRRERSVAELVARARALPEIVEDLTAAVDVLRPLSEAAEVQRLRVPGQALRYLAAVDRALVAVERLAARPGSSQSMGMIDIVELIRERLSLRPPRSTGKPICTAAGTGSYRVFGDRAGLAELVDRILDYMVAQGAFQGNVAIQSDGAEPSLSLAIEFVAKPPDGGAGITKEDGVLAEVWRARCMQLVETHGGHLEFPVEGRDTIRVRLPVRPTARITDQ